jgi:alkylation response protein AidB-like acyl-CoA dehydrogenase
LSSAQFRTGTPQFPREALRLIVQNDLHKRFYNARNGGVSTPELDLFDWLRFMGRADLSLGRLFEGHVNALKLIEWFGTPSQNRQLQQNLDNGMLYGVWATEPSNGVTLHSLGSELALRGCKSFASGAGSIDFAIVTAQPSTGSRRLVIVPADDISRTDLSGWKVRGMRSTMSGTYDLSGFNVAADDLLGEPGEYDLEPRFTSGAWRFLAVQLGGIEALVTETRAAISEAARHDPLQRLKFANAVEAMRTAYFWVHRSAVMFEQSDKQAPAFVRMARGVVERAALEVMTLSARIVGTRSAFDGQRIDKISRDLALYLRQGGPDYARDQAAIAWLEEDVWDEDDRLW